MQALHYNQGNKGRGSGRGKGRGNFPPLPNKEEIDLWRIYNPRVQKINKGSSSKSQLSDSPTIKVGTSSTIKVDNNYKEVLITEPDFIQNSTIDTILIVDTDIIKKANEELWNVKQLYLDNNCHPYPDGKDRFYYEAILRETESVEISHTFNKENQIDCTFSYSKCLIKKILFPSMWGFDLNKSRQLM